MPIHVISDLHIGAGNLDDCDIGCESALIAFIDRLTRAPAPVELVLNGDSFDFVQADPWAIGGLEETTADGVPLCFTRDISLRKAQAIMDAHSKVFDALARFVRRDGALLTVIPGNHDADLYWDEVRDLIGARIAGGDAHAGARLVWHLERVYRPARAPHVWIEHGHQYDPNNWFFVAHTASPTEYWGTLRKPILKDRHDQERLLECVGTRFLIRFLNQLDERYPFVDNIKPMSRFIGIFGSSARSFSGGTARAALSAFAFLRFIGVDAVVARGSLLGLAAEDGTLGARLQAIDKGSNGAFAKALKAAGCDFKDRSFERLTEDPAHATRVLDFALAHLDALDAVVIGGNWLSVGGKTGEPGKGELGLLKGLKLDETQLLREAASDALKNEGCQYVIMGHTHEFVDDPYYKNIGSWTRYWQMQAGDHLTWRQMVERAAKLPMAPRYVTILDDAARGVTLESFDSAA